MKNLNLRIAAEVTGGVLKNASGLEDTLLTGVAIDSREVQRGFLFAALPGEKTDGHRFMDSAFDKGAVCALASHMPENASGPVILTDSVPQALQSLAAWYRSQFDLPVIGLTGSVGKTTAKEMLRSVLSQKYTVLANTGNLNNELGVPLTLFRLREEHTLAVIEMGISDFGEMRRLARMVQPDCALFTVIGQSHLQFLGDRAGVLRAKAEMLEAVPEEGAVFLNGDDDLLAALPCSQRRILFGTGENADVRALNVRFSENGTCCCEIQYPVNLFESGKQGQIKSEQQVYATFSLEIPAYGEHMVTAALEGAAAGLWFGLTEEEICRGVAGFRPPDHRNRVVNTGRFTVVDDCYNANPTSVAAAIRSLTHFSGRKVCIFGDMLELGESADTLHQEIGEYAIQQGIALILSCGELSRYTIRGAGGSGVWFPDRETLIASLPSYLRDGDRILVKASHSMGFDKIVQALIE